MDQLIAGFDRQFVQLHLGSRELIAATPAALLYRRLDHSGNLFSGGEHVLRSAAAVEQTCGGLNANLWDDPFEWTLPETLSTPAKVLEYLDEVEATRRLSFSSFKDGADLSKQIMSPGGSISLQSLLLDTLVRAVHHQSVGQAILKLVR